MPVKVVPRAAADEIVGWLNGRLRIRIAAAPEAGRANASLEAFVAAELGLKRRQVRVVSGHTSALKLLEIYGIEPAELDRMLTPMARR